MVTPSILRAGPPGPPPAAEPRPEIPPCAGGDPKGPETPPIILGRQLGALLRRWGGWAGSKLERVEFPVFRADPALGHEQLPEKRCCRGRILALRCPCPPRSSRHLLCPGARGTRGGGQRVPWRAPCGTAVRFNISCFNSVTC